MKFKKAAALILAGGIALSNIAFAQVESEVTPVSSEINNENFKSEINYNNLEVYFKDKKIVYDIKPQVFNGKFMVPVRKTLEALDFKVEWNKGSKSVDISKNAFFTTIYIDENSYFKHKMAPINLSSSPIIINERTLVPVEFLTQIIGYGVSIEEDKLIIHDEEFASRSGYIYEIKEYEKGLILTVTTNKETKESFKEDSTDRIIVSVIKDSTIVNKDSLEIGDYITVVHFPYMIMIYPPQTSAQIIF